MVNAKPRRSIPPLFQLLPLILLWRARGRLVTEGAFQYSRNPIYLGGMVFFFGLAILLGSLVGFIFPAIIFMLVHFLYIPNEEEELKTMFGEEYLDYLKRVRKWI